MLQGNGKLLGVRGYKKEDKDRFIYYVLSGERDGVTGLMNNPTLITIIEDTLKISNPVYMEDVTYLANVNNFGGAQTVRYSDIKRVKK